MKFKDLKQTLLESNADFRKKYYTRNLALELGHLITLHRVRKGVTQEELAVLLGTQQPSVARAERGKVVPSVTFLERVAEKLGMLLVIDFREASTHTIGITIGSQRGYVASPIQLNALIPYSTNQNTTY
ncbi:MAG: Uncharacterized protein Athens041674_95 [Parcubacteria group bacterium Athens0416_74]|nr:MAG: Uncharacterized protein Athens041674_95 [Parcubacteria group bacterium Athens0416_74]